MRAFLQRMGFRCAMLAFVPYIYVATALAAPRMLIDWQLRREWLADVRMLFSLDGWEGFGRAFVAGEPV
jgi:hypothetical protein